MTIPVWRFDISTRVFQLERNVISRIIYDRFGELSIHTDFSAQWMELISAVIRDTLFNRDTTRRHYLPLCVGNVYIYHYMKEQDIDRIVTTTVTADSVIDGLRYYHLEGEGPLTGWYRSDLMGVYHYQPGNVEFMIQSDVSIGTWTNSGMVVDTAWQNDLQPPRFQTHIWVGWRDYYRTIDWLEGIGVMNTHRWGWLGGSESYDLVYANVCGTEYGSPVHVESTTTVPETAEIRSIMPHPVVQSSIVSFALHQASHVRLELTDYLGRQLILLRDEELSAVTHQAVLDAGDLIPGLYFCILRTADATTLRKIILLR